MTNGFILACIKEIHLKTFEISDEDEVKLSNWLNEHGKTCHFFQPGTPVGAISGILTYSFTDTSIGRLTEVLCACGEKIGLNDDI